jgi:hypothetical protein
LVVNNEFEKAEPEFDLVDKRVIISQIVVNVFGIQVRNIVLDVLLESVELEKDKSEEGIFLVELVDNGVSALVL